MLMTEDRNVHRREEKSRVLELKLCDCVCACRPVNNGTFWLVDSEMIRSLRSAIAGGDNSRKAWV